MAALPDAANDVTGGQLGDTKPATPAPAASPSAKAALLKRGVMPDYRAIHESEEQLENLWARRRKTQQGRQGVPQSSQPLIDAETSEQAAILHAMFAKFCRPVPSMEGILSAVLLENRRVASLRENNNDEGGTHDVSSARALENELQRQLPTEAIVSASSEAAHFIIKLLRTPPKMCLLKLPLEFQLAFFRILTRVLTEESDDEFDEECLFDWGFLEDGEECETEAGECDEGRGSSATNVVSDVDVGNGGGSDDDSYDVVRKSSLGGRDRTSSASLTNRDRATSSSSQRSFQRASSAENTGKAFETWSFGRWKKKKSAPLYSVVRFCTNSQWREGVSSNAAGSRRRSLPWSFVADNVRLDAEEEEELARECNENDDEAGGMTQHASAGEDLAGMLISIFQTTLDQCLASSNGDTNNQYLLLGPVTHLIGLVCATGVSVKNLRLLLVMGDDAAQNNPSHPALILARLHIVRALRYAAEYSIQFNGILDKPGPSDFFSFGKRDGREGGWGLSTTVTMPWPFKYDFGMACWFRADSFSPCSNSSILGAAMDGEKSEGKHVVLFSARTENGAQIEVSFEPHSVDSADGQSSAATLIVTVIDATSDPNASKTLRRVRLVGCVLSPLVWYHVAVRLSHPRLSRFSLAPFSSKDEVSIFLNGKLMLKEPLKMPQFPDAKSGGRGVGSGLASIGSLGSFHSAEPKNVPLELSLFSSNFDGQAGALYVFKDHVSEASINALYHETISLSEQSGVPHFGSFVDRWDAEHGKLNHLARAVSSASMHSELGDIVLPNFSVFTGEHSQKRRILFDLAKEEDVDQEQIPVGLSRAAFGSKLLAVWDPARIDSGMVLDPHLRVCVSKGDRVSTWSFTSVRDTVESLGGMQRLLPLFEVLQHLSPGQENACASKGILRDCPNMLIPSLLFLVSSFIRGHEANACELFRCGGINVIEMLLHEMKRKDIDGKEVYRLGSSALISDLSASALLDIWQAARLNFALETTVFSRLLFNTPLLLGGVAKSRGVSFHRVMLPSLSEIAMMNPNKVRDCVEIGEILDIVNEYSTSGSEDPPMPIQETAEEEPFREHTSPGLTLTSAERCFVIDSLFGMVAMMLANRCQAQHLAPLLTFITYNLDLEWEASSADVKIEGGSGSATRSLRYLSTVKAVSILFFLLQKPNVPSLIDSLADIFENGNCVASWILCCLVNSFDDTIRGLGIRCLTAYLRTTTSTATSNAVTVPTLPSSHDGAAAKISKLKHGLEAIGHSANNMLSSVLSGRANIKVIYKLLWHLLKCHRDRLGVESNSALMYLIVDDGSAIASSIPLTDIILPNSEMLGGFCLSVDELSGHSSKDDSRQTTIQNKYGVSTVLRLLRFLPNDQKERWLFDLLALLLASPKSVSIILSCDDWQPVLFLLVAEVLDEIYGDDADSATEDESNVDATGNERASSHSGLSAVNTETLSRPSVRTRYDLSLKLYSTLLAHCVRQGDEKAFDAVEMAASLQRVDPNGSEIFSILLSHLFADLIEKGTVASVERTYSKADAGNAGRNRALKQSAKLVTDAILSNGSAGLGMALAVKQWRCLRHLTALSVAVVTESGFGVVELFDYRNQDASAIDGITGGMYGIRLDNLVSGVNAFEALAGAKLHTNTSGRNRRDRYRYVSVVLASQMLTLLDAFIFPDNLDTSKEASQLHGLALVRSTEPRLGQSQGTLLSSLIRLSLILLAYLEPSSVKFLQACSRLRCFLHWALEILRESVALGGYSQAFHELTAPLDRMVLAIVLQCHRALARCSAVLVEMESSPWQKYFSAIDERQKSQRRLFRAILELKEIVLAAFRGRNEVLRASLSPPAHDALARGLEEGPSAAAQNGEHLSKEATLRAFLENEWASGFHDVDSEDSLVLPEQIANGQIHQGQAASMTGKQAIEALASESAAIVKEYTDLLNAPFTVYCETQRKWAETDAVRDREYEGDVSVKRLSSKYRTDAAESSKSTAVKYLLAVQRMARIAQLANDPWNQCRHWTFTSKTDLLYRRIVFHPNHDFDDHAEASYELSLGKEREAEKRAAELRREKKEREMAEAALRAAIVPYEETMEEDEAEDEDADKAGNEVFLGWGVEPGDMPLEHGDEEEKEVAVNEEKDALTNEDNIDDSEWDQIESSDFDESNELDPFAWARKFMWADGERFVHNFESVVIVSVRNTRAGTLLLTSHSIYFHQTGDTIDVITKEKMATDSKGGPSKEDRKWKLNRLTDIHGRRYLLKSQALELFFANMEGVFLTFDGPRERDLFHSKLRNNCKAPLLRSFKSLNPRVVYKKSKLTDLWRKRKISNFQYIMALNLMAGRTFNDLTQYPVFPWVLADYTSETLDLSDESVYRDLSKPVGALNPDRLEMLIDRYNDLDGFPEEEKFLYGSHYSSPGVVLHYLIRQEPYTSMHIALQSGRFDCPDRLFFDMEGCWRSCNTSTSDVKELIPEFFVSPEIFMNTNQFPLGETQTKMPIDNVKLPPWAKGSPYEFVRLHRLALESEYVSNNLHQWVDLIFGCKQRGPAALDAHNLFHYLSYEGSVDIDKVTDELERKAIEGHIQNFGQTPSQLITKEPHPARSSQEEDPLPLFKDLCLENMRCDKPTKQFGGPKKPVAGAIVSMHVLGDTLFAIHSSLTLCSYKLQQARGSVPFYFKHDKARVVGGKDASRSYNVLGRDNNAGAKNGESDEPKSSDEDSQPIGSMAFGIALGVNSSVGSSGSSADMSHLLVSSGWFDDCVKVHSLDSAQLQSSHNGGHRGRINCLEVGEEGEMMVTGGEDATCRIWIIDHDALSAAITDGFVKSSLGSEGPEENRCSVSHVLLGHVTPVCSLAICTKLDVVISGSQDGSICIHNMRSGTFVRSLHVDASTKEVHHSCAGNGIAVKKLAMHMDGLFAAHLSDGSLHVFSVNGERLCHADIDEQLNAMIICPKSEALITGGDMGCVRVWSLYDLGLQCTVDVKKHGAITSLALTPAGSQFLCVGSSNGLLSVVSRKE